MTRTTIPNLLLPALCLALVCGCGSGEEAFAVSTEEDPQVELSARFQLPPGSRPIETVQVAASVLWRDLTLPGSVGFNEDQRASISAGVEGLVAEVDVRLGDRVRAGQRLALISSRELARARSAYVESIHHVEFAQVALEREKKLWERKITSEEAYLKARHAVQEAEIERQTREQELLALGLTREQLARIHPADDESIEGSGLEDFTRYERRSPLDGFVVERHAVLGEVVGETDVLFEVADLSTVWVDLQVQASELAQLRVGTPVVVESLELGTSSEAELAYLDARVNPRTQAGLARIELANPDGLWRPGLFVAVHLEVARHQAPLAIPVESLHHFPAGPGGVDLVRVFVQLDDGSYEAREVELGVQGSQEVEVLRGLEASERVAVGAGLLLKSAWLGQGGLEE